MPIGSQIVNGLGKFLKKHLTGSGTVEKDSNTCTVYIPISYTVKTNKDSLDDCVSKDTPDEMGTITVQICIKAYGDKIAVSIFNGDLTIGYKTYTIASFDDNKTGCEKVLNTVKKRIGSTYPQYDFKFDSL